MEQRISQFVEKVGIYFESQGMPLSAGRVLGLLMVSEDALTLDEIAATLEISKASVSLGTRMLEKATLIDRVTVRGDRKIRYQMAHSPWASSLKQKNTVLVYLADLAKEGQQILPEAAEISRTRLKEMEEFYRYLAVEFERVMHEWIKKH